MRSFIRTTSGAFFTAYLTLLSMLTILAWLSAGVPVTSADRVACISVHALLGLAAAGFLYSWLWMKDTG